MKVEIVGSLYSLTIIILLQTKLDLSPEIEVVLQECPFGTKRNVEDCVFAAQSLQKALGQELTHGLSILQEL